MLAKRIPVAARLAKRIPIAARLAKRESNAAVLAKRISVAPFLNFAVPLWLKATERIRPHAFDILSP